MVFESVEQAECKIEPIDVSNDEFVYYDGEGLVLRASVYTDQLGVSRTKIYQDPKEGSNRTGLRQILIEFLTFNNYSTIETERMSLSELVKESIKFPTE